MFLSWEESCSLAVGVHSSSSIATVCHGAAMSWEYRGILPAMQLPFEQDLTIDEAELRRFTSWLAGHKGIGGLVTNGHTGEVFALTAEQRAQTTRIVVDEVGGRL